MFYLEGDLFFVQDEFTWGVDEILPEMRETYANRETVTKLEALMMFLIRGNLPYSYYKKYVDNLLEFKGAGLYANDIDRGNFTNLNAKRN